MPEPPRNESTAYYFSINKRKNNAAFSVLKLSVNTFKDQAK